MWGGESSDSGPALGDGAAFDPVTNSWRSIAASPLTPRGFHVAAWTGEEMLIVGGNGERDGAAYNPATDSWRPIEESPLLVGPSSVMESPGAVWTGQELVIWDISSNQAAAYAPISTLGGACLLST